MRLNSRLLMATAVISCAIVPFAAERVFAAGPRSVSPALSDTPARFWREPAGDSALANLPPIESTGFEAGDGWVAGTELCGGPANGFCAVLPPFANQCPAAGTNCCAADPHPTNQWFRSATDQHCFEPHIETVHPASGAQHLRLAFDPAGGNPLGCAGVSNTACRATAFTPDMGQQFIGGYQTEFDIAFPNFSGGVTFQYFNVTSSGATDVYMLFYFDGTIHLLDYSTTPATPVHVPFDTTGAYGHVDVLVDPCFPGETDRGRVEYRYNGALLLATPLPTVPILGGHGSNRRAVLATDNGLDTVDVDNYEITRAGPPPSICDNGVLECGELCDGGAGYCPPGRCDQATCYRCIPICTLADPCILDNGANGPFPTPCDPNYGCIFVYQADTEVVSIDTCGSTFDTQIFFWGSANDLADPGNANDDCCDPADPNCGASFGAGSDPSASCYNNVAPPNGNLVSCTCYDLPTPGDNIWLAQVTRSGPAIPPLGEDVFVFIDKKQTCGVEWENGACCDTNNITSGDPAGCTDDVAPGDCVGADKVFTLNKFCAGVHCECIPDCTGAECGDDGCGGSCGTCNDGLACTTDACNPERTCSSQPIVCDDGIACTSDVCFAGSCVSTPNDAVCDDGLFCTGFEICIGTGCSSSGNPCADGLVCNEDTDTCDYPVIPTVSEWGLVVMALLLLTGAKIYFGRREMIA